MKLNNRSLHRDVAYFYVGLIIAFSFSGIILNHRQDWYPMDYTYEDIPVTIDLPENLESLDESSFSEIIETHELTYDQYRLRGEELRVYFEGNATMDIDVATGKGSIEFKRKVPVVGHSMYLHKSTNKFWIWYSDIFGAAMLLIAITGILIPSGKNGFKSRGWKLALAGMIFPLLFLFILS